MAAKGLTNLSPSSPPPPPTSKQYGITINAATKADAAVLAEIGGRGWPMTLPPATDLTTPTIPQAEIDAYLKANWNTEVIEAQLGLDNNATLVARDGNGKPVGMATMVRRELIMGLRLPSFRPVGDGENRGAGGDTGSSAHGGTDDIDSGWTQEEADWASL
ncbi:Uu.00g001750.m01.CDS01 [Anthostomella pinea]|uniref:Uu.00g001750.m01.CDS01 n=1 Tax=Anthostomella pinea TaxID=933095 RepID=A0AAI8YIF8_9PEZI|nr:Uu.00g001750.m01.CDS01 [Anthostomella pinea]